MLGRKRSMIAIDIGTSSVKMVQLEYVGTEPSLVKSGLVELGPPEKEKDRDEATIEAIREVMHNINTKGAKIVSVVSGPKTSVRQIVIPHMPKAEMPEAIKWEAREHVSFPIDDAIIDFEVLGEVVDKEVKNLQMMVAIASRDVVDNCLALLRAAGIKPSSITATPFSLWSLIRRVGRISEDEVVAIVNIGSEKTDINIFKGRTLTFNREILTAGNSITKAMTGTLVSDLGSIELNIDQAEKLKRKSGIPEEGKAEEIAEGLSSPQILAMIRPVLERLSNEISRTFIYYREEHRGGKVSRVILSGGSAKLKGIKEFLADRLGVEVEIGDPFANLRISVRPQEKENLQDVGPRLAVATGCALTEARGINLIPIEIKEETKRFVERVSIKAMVTAVIGILFIIYGTMRLQLVIYQKKSLGYRVEQRALSTQLQDVIHYEKVQNEMMQKKLFLGKILKDEPPWSEILKEISNIIPPDMILDQLEMENHILIFKGTIFAEEKAADSILVSFMFALEGGIFKNINLVSLKRSGESTRKFLFEINCELG